MMTDAQSAIRALEAGPGRQRSRLGAPVTSLIQRLVTDRYLRAL